ncbi:hyaluronan-binding protein 2 [Pyxicephalus adspersus]|uniref:hyaluronan-binding protein 2 n=1 Tax=Pyxicephalus adspersus TaxID=30357 RepID=UPI003B5BE953
MLRAWPVIGLTDFIGMAVKPDADCTAYRRANVFEELEKSLAENVQALNLYYYDDLEDPCLSQPCFNHGTCVPTERGYMCRCTEFFTGLNCDKAIRPCNNTTCLNGECVLKKMAPYYKCRCHYPYHGPSCNLVEDVCKYNPCKHGGTWVVKGQNKFSCDCTRNRRGRFCEIEQKQNAATSLLKVDLEGRVSNPKWTENLFFIQRGNKDLCLEHFNAKHVHTYRDYIEDERKTSHESHDCYRNNGFRYRGHVSRTESGHRCLPWDSYHLSKEDVNAFVPDIWQYGIGEHNFCRNPDGAEKPWCYYLDGKKKLRWDECEVSHCPRVLRLNITTIVKPPSTTVIPSTTATVKNSFTTCGIRENSGIRGRIVGGKRTQPGKHPWLASLQVQASLRGLEFRHLCGGTLIAECWILTAGHCMKAVPFQNFWRVFLGKTDLMKNESSEQVLEVEKIIVHEKYMEGAYSLHNDIALIKLKKVNGTCARETRFVKTACLPDREFPPGKTCEIAGWGMTENGFPDYLLEASVQVISEANCSDPTIYGKYIDKSMLCAGVPEGGIDACQGDSGGPLACEWKGVTQVAGMVSWGDKCGMKNKPGVYTHVYRFVPWIIQTMKANS